MSFIEEIISPLQQFADFAIRAGFSRFMPPPDNVSIIDGAHIVILHREGPFQLELFTVSADRVPVCPHRAAGVECVYIHVAGGEDTLLISEGIRYTFNRALSMVFVADNALHSIEGRENISFMIAQHWKTGNARKSILDVWKEDKIDVH